MLLVGVDWAEARHAACLMQPAGTVVRRLTIPHSAAGLARLREAIAAVEVEPAGVLVAVERPDGLLVEALLDKPRQSLGYKCVLLRWQDDVAGGP